MCFRSRRPTTRAASFESAWPWAKQRAEIVLADGRGGCGHDGKERKDVIYAISGEIESARAGPTDCSFMFRGGWRQPS